MYVPLRVHGYHSFLTGVDSPTDLVQRAQQLGLPALALADVDGLAGSIEFLHACRRQVEEDSIEQDPIGKSVSSGTESSGTESSGNESNGNGTHTTNSEWGSLRPIIAAEFSDPDGLPGRLVALVCNERGYRNLCRLISARQEGEEREEGPDGRDAEGSARTEPFDLAQSAALHHEGLIFLTDHPRLLIALHGLVPRENLLAAISPACLQKGPTLDARALSGRSRNTHREKPAGSRRSTQTTLDGCPEEIASGLGARKTPAPARAIAAADLIDAARAIGVGTVAVPDVYWALPGGEREHRVRVAIKHNALLEDLPEEWLAEYPGHLLTPLEMRALYVDLPEVRGPWAERCTGEYAALEAASEARHGPLPGALRRTLQVAERCRYTPPLGGVSFPDVQLEEGETPYSLLCQLAFDGARKRYRPLRPEVLRRLDYELDTIQKLGFAPYFILVNRIADFARERKIPSVGRGSAADSLVAYCLELTDADPLRYRLPFERFLNPARRDRPDIDLDFCWRRRDEVLEHVFKLFGEEHTAMISTLNRFGLRSAFREAALAHGIPPAEVNYWSARLPHHFVAEGVEESLPFAGA